MFTSVLKRAQKTGAAALAAAGLGDTPMVADWRLNERHYGGLTGLDKAETAAKHGEDQVHVWRRSYDVPPPPLVPGGEYDFAADPRYAGQPIPDTESLIAAHGNSLRAVVKLLFAVPDDKIVGVEIPTGNPLEITLDAGLKPTAARYLDADRAEALPVLP
jgi:2,3-bisphosphoglycerate-dependent phosphoglycerate mutase